MTTAPLDRRGYTKFRLSYEVIRLIGLEFIMLCIMTRHISMKKKLIFAFAKQRYRSAAHFACNSPAPLFSRYFRAIDTKSMYFQIKMSSF